MKVLVTGASGKTGALVVAQLLKPQQQQQGDDTTAPAAQFEVRATVRTPAARELLLSLGVAADDVFSVDLSSSEDATASAALKVALQGCDALVICTSAVPQVKLIPTLLGGAAHWLRQRLPGRKSADGGGVDQPFVPVATWKGGQTPQQVDWQGQLKQIDAAKAAGVRHIVLVSSAGGCNPRHFLNFIGNGEVQGQRGNILNWKRAAEQHLIAWGGTYTILHPNHLIDDADHPYQLVLGVDDTIQQPHWRQRLRMPRSLLAALAVHCLLLRDEGAGNRSIDCAGRAVAGASLATTSTEQVKQLLREMPQNCDYSLNDRTLPAAVFV